MVAMALTDFSNFCGLVKFYGEALGSGLKPIIGADIFVRPEPDSEDFFELTLLAKNNTGYHNITLLLSKAYQQGYVEFPLVEKAWLAELNEGIIVLSGGRNGDVGKALLKENEAEADELVGFYQQYFPNHYYLALCRTGRTDEERYIQQAVPFSQKHQLPLVAVNDVVFLKKTILMRTKFVWQSTTATPWMILNVRKNIHHSNISVANKKCVPCLPIYRKRLKIQYKLQCDAM